MTGDSEVLSDQAPDVGAPEADSAEMAELRLLRGGAPTGDVFPVSGSAVVGRFDPAVGPVDVDLGPLDEGVYVSRKHAKIAFADGTWMLEDLGSSNGTFKLDPASDFQRISEPVSIADGDVIAFGNARFSFHVKSELAPSDAAEPEDDGDAEQEEEGEVEDE